jgi:glycosyltransferase involved in cell wall biosynthesis
MPKQLPRILVLSATDPTKALGAVALNFYNALKAHGYEVDFLTKHRVMGRPEFKYVLDLTRWPNYIRYKLNKRQERISTHKGSDIEQQGNHAFDYGREDDPPIAVEKVLKQIDKQYDAVFVVFWYQMLSYKTIEAIYNKLHCQIHIRCADNQPIAGGCHFIGGCPRLSEGCGECPGLVHGAADDFTRFNIEYRKQVLAKVHPIIYGNTHMQMIYRQAALLKDYDRLETVYPLVDNDHFHPVDKQQARQQLGLPTNKFILFFGSTVLTEERKGMKYLLQALDIFYDQLTDEQRNDVLLVIAGHHVDALREHIRFEMKDVGFVPFNQLPLYYAMANAYLSPSIDDAGPSMVNQSLSCGTPVVAFNIGTALDMILHENTGYCAQLRDAADFAKGISNIYQSTPEEYQAMCEECRHVAMKKTSEEAFVSEFQRIYEKYQ